MRALSLFSGGLDSQLSAALLKQQNIEVIALHFMSPFFGEKETTQRAADHLGIELVAVPVGESYMRILKEPVYGYGKFHNPCIDCHAFMIRTAGEMLKAYNASFIITGEVLGQRPMSQTRSALERVNKLTRLGEITLRPLSAKRLDPTLPEQSGWVDREKLMDIQGRSRHLQISLAAAWGIEEYPAPAGGCLLTLESPTQRLRNYFSFLPQANLEELYIIRYGRHIYLDANFLLVIGRNQAENQALQINKTPEDLLLRVTNRPGPIGLLRRNSLAQEFIPQKLLQQAAALVARYSDAREEPLAEVRLYNDESEQIMMVAPASIETA